MPTQPLPHYDANNDTFRDSSASQPPPSLHVVPSALPITEKPAVSGVKPLTLISAMVVGSLMWIGIGYGVLSLLKLIF